MGRAVQAPSTDGPRPPPRAVWRGSRVLLLVGLALIVAGLASFADTSLPLGLPAVAAGAVLAIVGFEGVPAPRVRDPRSARILALSGVGLLLSVVGFVLPLRWFGVGVEGEVAFGAGTLLAVVSFALLAARDARARRVTRYLLAGGVVLAAALLLLALVLYAALFRPPSMPEIGLLFKTE